MEKKFINPPDMQKPAGYTHVVTVENAKLIFISGQVAVDANGQIVGKGDLKAQAQKAWENLATALKAAGATLADIVKLNTYVVNADRERIRIVREARAAVMKLENMPASTLVGVQALASDDFMIEIEAVAAVK